MDAPALCLAASQLPTKARSDFEFWRGHIEPLLSHERGVLRELRDLADTLGVPFGTVKTKYYTAKQRGIAALIDKRLAGPRWWNSVKLQPLSRVDQELVKLYCERNQRSSKSAIKQLRADWTRGLVKTETPVDPRTRMPRGWSPRNLLRYAPSKYELKAARIGRSAAASERQLVYTTRKGLWVGSHYMFDDMWHDFFVNSFVERQAGRPLELFSHDLYSARKVRWGIRVRTAKDDGRMNGLTEAMTRMILAATLHLDGYSPRGTVLVAEHGTAAISERIEKALAEISWSNGQSLITVSRSGMQGDKAHFGQYDGVSRGNPRFKASLESSNNLIHNVFASLPGQTGKDRQNAPEQLTNLLKHNADLLAARNQLPPERAELLQFLLLEQTQFMHVATELYRQIENDTDHNLEGWVECGHVVNELLMGEQWIDQRLLLADPAQSALALQLIAAGQLQTRPRKMSRREVWNSGAGELVRLPGYGVVAILGDDLARERRVTRGMFEFQDSEVGHGVHRFDALAVAPTGERMRLVDGETYETFVNPFEPDTLFVRRANGEYVGECVRMDTPCRGDVDAVHRACGRAAKAESEALAPIRARHMQEAREKAGRAQRNADVIAGRPVTPIERHRDAELADTEFSAEEISAALGGQPEEGAQPFSAEEVSQLFAPTEPEENQT